MRIALSFSNKFFFLFILASIILSKVNAQSLSKKQQDSLYLLNPSQERIRKIKKSFAKKFVNFVGNDISLYGGLVLSKLTINDNGITVPTNYLYNDLNTNSFNSGFNGGFRLDGIYKEKHPYSLNFAINRITAGAYYKNIHSLSPFIGDFTHFKADNVFTTFSFSFHYKVLLPFTNRTKYKFYAVAGPSLDYKISRISNAQLINGTGNRGFLNADLGTEFDNKGYYILFAHYKLGRYLASSIVPVQLNRFEIGMSIKSKDLF
jgi:hypothetical protein